MAGAGAQDGDRLQALGHGAEPRGGGGATEGAGPLEAGPLEAAQAFLGDAVGIGSFQPLVKRWKLEFNMGLSARFPPLPPFNPRYHHISIHTEHTGREIKP